MSSGTGSAKTVESPYGPFAIAADSVKRCQKTASTESAAIFST